MHVYVAIVDPVWITFKYSQNRKKNVRNELKFWIFIKNKNRFVNVKL